MAKTDESKQPEEAPLPQGESSMDTPQADLPNRQSLETEEKDDAFVNEGFQNWEERRARWLLGETDSSNSTARAAVPVEVDEIIDIIFSQRWRSPDSGTTIFPHHVPLPQMVDILVDLWEAEGLDV